VDTEKFYADPNNAPQVLGDLRGKTLRLNLDGSVPSDNPFVKREGARPEVYTFGHRNPYSMNIDPETGKVFVGEVGYDRPEDFEEINLLQGGGNYGWPRCIGPNKGTYGGDCPIENATVPWLFYAHDKNGANATSGPFYRKNGGQYEFPASFQNGMFYADYSRKWIRFAQVDPATYTVTSTMPFARGFGGPLAMQQGPDGGLYFNEYAGWFTGAPKDRIARIIYVGEKTAEAKP
jgi:glucose/arabinose dehydrogenase